MTVSTRRRLRVALDGHASDRRRGERTAASAGSRCVGPRGRAPSRGRRRGRAPGRSRVAGRRTRRGSRRSGPHRGGVTRRRRRSIRRTAATDGRHVRSGSRRAPSLSRTAASSASRIASTCARCAARRRGHGTASGSGARKRRGSGWIRITVPPAAIGGAFRQSRSASPSPRYAAVIGIRALAGQPGRRRRDPDHERVQRLAERNALQHRRPEERLGVRDRRRAGVHGRRRLLARKPLEDPLPDAARRDLERAGARANRSRGRSPPGRADTRRTAHRAAARSGRARRR